MDVKPGYQTTEFWLTVATQLFAAIGTLAGFLPEPWGPALIAIGTVGYNVSRGMTKRSGPPTATAAPVTVVGDATTVKPSNP